MIYSSQIHQLEKENQTYKFLFDINYMIIFSWIEGEGNIIDSDNEITINENNRNYITYAKNDLSLNNNNLTFHSELRSKIPYNDMEELIIGNIFSGIYEKKEFPRFYYFNNFNNDEIDINIYIRETGETNNNLNINTNFSIKAFIVENKNLQKRVKGESIDLVNKIEGIYDAFTKNGFINITKEEMESIKDIEQKSVLLQLFSNNFEI